MGELLSTAVFAGAATFVVGLLAPSNVGVWIALAPLLLILVQGGMFWLVAVRWVGGGVMPRPLVQLYRLFRIVDPLLLVAAAVGAVWWRPEPIGWVLMAAGIWLFAVIEYLNYFVVRLSYPVRSWWSTVTQWRTPRLVMDVQQGLGSPERTRFDRKRSSD